jgi:hypothetical protein
MNSRPLGPVMQLAAERLPSRVQDRIAAEAFVDSGWCAVTTLAGVGPRRSPKIESGSRRHTVSTGEFGSRAAEELRRRNPRGSF